MKPENETVVLVAGLLVANMGVPKETVYVYNAKWKIPATEGLFISVGLIGWKPYGSSIGFANGAQAGEPALIEQQSMNVQEILTVTLFSRNSEARMAMPSLLFALNSTQAQQLQEQQAMKFGRLPLTFVDISETEASARLNKFSYTFNVLRSYSRDRVVEYFDQFPTPELLINQ